MKRTFIAFYLSVFLCLIQAVTICELKSAESLTPDMKFQPTQVDVALGSNNAPITIVEYTSLTCAHCADFHLNVLPVIKEKYIDSGQLRLVIRPYPMEKYSMQAFKLLNTVPEQNRELALTKIFGSQMRWNGKEATVLAKILGLNDIDCKKALENQDIENSILACTYKAQNDFKVDATPTFFIAGKKLEGAPTLAEFTASFEELKKEKKLS